MHGNIVRFGLYGAEKRQIRRQRLRQMYRNAMRFRLFDDRNILRYGLYTGNERHFGHESVRQVRSADLRANGIQQILFVGAVFRLCGRQRFGRRMHDMQSLRQQLQNMFGSGSLKL